MKGLELAKEYYEAFGKEMLDRFPEIKDKVTVAAFNVR